MERRTLQSRPGDGALKAAPVTADGPAPGPTCYDAPMDEAERKRQEAHAMRFSLARLKAELERAKKQGDAEAVKLTEANIRWIERSLDNLKKRQ